VKKMLAASLSNRIKELREATGLSQQDLAVKAGLSLSQVAKLEQGTKADPRASTVLALAYALGVTPGRVLDELLPADVFDPVSLAAAGREVGRPVKRKARKKGGKKARKGRKRKARGHRGTAVGKG
jgi:transcriptional regulator with XRE-family HTH domain